MIKKLLKYRILLIILILVLCVLFVESPYFGDYYGDPPYDFYFLVTFLNLLLYLLPTHKLLFFEKLIYAAIVSIAVLIAGLLTIESILGSIYGYDAYYGELKTAPILADSLFYFIINGTGIGIFAFWLKYKEQRGKSTIENKYL
jgi:hypothetical protein